MNNKEPGYVYILTNPSFREDWVKINKPSYQRALKRAFSRRGDRSFVSLN